MKNYFSPAPTIISLITGALGSTLLHRLCALTFSNNNVLSFVAVAESRRNVIFKTKTGYEKAYIISLVDRFNHANTTLTASQCLKFCNDKNSHVVGSDKVVSSTDFERYLNQSFGHGELLREGSTKSFIDPKSPHNKRDGKSGFHVNAFYNFTKAKWLNQLTLSTFDDELWARYHDYHPLFPIVNDVLGIVLKT